MSIPESGGNGWFGCSLIHMYLNRDISHIDGFAGGNEIRVSKSNMHMHMQTDNAAPVARIPSFPSLHQFKPEFGENIAINGTAR